MTTIAGLSGKQIRDKLDGDDWAARQLAAVICSSCWGGACVDLRLLGTLDIDDWLLALAIMNYRRTHIGDLAFYDLAAWCRTRHNLTQFHPAIEITSR